VQVEWGTEALAAMVEVLEEEDLEPAMVEAVQVVVAVHAVAVRLTAAGTATTTTMMTPRHSTDLASIPTSGLTRLTTAQARITSKNEGAGTAATVAVDGTVAINKVRTFKDTLRSGFSECHHKVPPHLPNQLVNH